MEEDIKYIYQKKMKNKLYGLLQEREKNGKWEKFLDTILIELLGDFNKEKSFNYYVLFYKLSVCKYLSFKYFRNIIFECMNLIDRLDVHELF